MHTKEICEFLSRDSKIVLAELLKQYWDKERYCYIGTLRPNYGIMLLISGNAKFVFEGGVLQVNAGDIVFLPKYSNYEAIFENKIEDYLVNFNIEGESIDLKVPTLIFGNAPIGIYERYAQLVEESNSTLNTKLNKKALFYMLLDGIVKNANFLIYDNYSVIDRAKRLLVERNKYTIEEIAKLCKISSSGLRKKFKESVGITLSEYRCKQKIAKAKYMLESTNMSIAEISDALDFYDAPYFCKMFKKFEGISPKKYVETKHIM